MPAETERPRRRVLNGLRRVLGHLVWTICLLAALCLAVAALLITVGANPANTLVSFVLDLADVADVGVFDLGQPIVAFDGESAATNTVLVNYGVGALCWLVVGRLGDRILRPR
ncbi:hypothetical protein [Nocardioides insulae]|uniref:hypothetical protein n=1 Tax=Nocardioides insulae TaxID=394734 RepID=UPI000684B357|nr:hypothetical protein [Nocardioides insulae]